MAKIAFCIYCESLDVTETLETVANPNVRPRLKYEYYCHGCGESWGDDESEFETGL